MAIEIIRKKKIRIFNWLIPLFYACLIFLCLSIIAYFVLIHFFHNLYAEFDKIRQKVENKREEPILRQRDKFLNYQKKFKDFRIIIKEQNFGSNFFEFFEDLIHPKVWFSDFSFDLKAKKVSLTGQAEDFTVVGEQIYIFKREPKIKEVKIFNAFRIEEKISFKLELQIDPQVLRFDFDEQVINENIKQQIEQEIKEQEEKQEEKQAEE